MKVAQSEPAAITCKTGNGGRSADRCKDPIRDMRVTLGR